MRRARLLVVGAPAGLGQQRISRALHMGPDRLRFVPRVSAWEYRHAYAEVDIALDPVPFSGATTTLDSLWQGVPVITLPGSTSASRSSASILAVAQLKEFLAASEDDYLSIAAHWAGQLSALAQMRATLRERLAASPLLDARRFTGDLETSWRLMWTAWCRATGAPYAQTRSPPKFRVDSLRASRWRRADLAYLEARALLDEGNLDAAIPKLQRLLTVHQNWELVQREYASAVLAWALRHPEVQLGKSLPDITSANAAFVSVVICSIDEAKLARVVRNFGEIFRAVEHEIIVIRDAKSLCEGFNRGASRARGEILLFSHDDIEIVTPDFASRLLQHLAYSDIVGVAGTSKVVSGNWTAAGQPYLHGHAIHRPPGETGYTLFVAGCNRPVMEGIEALDGVFMATHRAVWERIGFDQETFDGFHLYDVDFSYRAALKGFRLAVCLDLTLIHESTGSYKKEWGRYARRFETKFAGQLAHRPEVIPGTMHCRLQTLEQVERLLAGLAAFQYGASMHLKQLRAEPGRPRVMRDSG